MSEAKASLLDLTAVLSAASNEARRLLIDQSRIVEIRYDTSASRSISNRTRASKDMNKEILSDLLREGANIYAIWGRPDASSEWKIFYVGQRKEKEIKWRLINHLFYKNDRTGAKLEAVKELIGKEFRIGISVLRVVPDEARTAIEELIIKDIQPQWNSHGKAKA